MVNKMIKLNLAWTFGVDFGHHCAYIKPLYSDWLMSEMVWKALLWLAEWVRCTVWLVHNLYKGVSAHSLGAQISQLFSQKHACDMLCYHAVVMILPKHGVNRDGSCLVFFAEERSFCVSHFFNRTPTWLWLEHMPDKGRSFTVFTSEYSILRFALC